MAVAPNRGDGQAKGKVDERFAVPESPEGLAQREGVWRLLDGERSLEQIQAA